MLLAVHHNLPSIPTALLPGKGTTVYTDMSLRTKQTTHKHHHHHNPTTTETMY